LPKRGILCFKAAPGLEERGTEVQDEEDQRGHRARLEVILSSVQSGRGFRHTHVARSIGLQVQVVTTSTELTSTPLQQRASALVLRGDASPQMCQRNRI
jgi:hypothetical protein